MKKKKIKYTYFCFASTLIASMMICYKYIVDYVQTEKMELFLFYMFFEFRRTLCSFIYFLRITIKLKS